jgi:hypothetical protein
MEGEEFIDKERVYVAVRKNIKADITRYNKPGDFNQGVCTGLERALELMDLTIQSINEHNMSQQRRGVYK